jgi:hypothetical protein
MANGKPDRPRIVRVVDSATSFAVALASLPFVFFAIEKFLPSWSADTMRLLAAGMNHVKVWARIFY